VGRPVVFTFSRASSTAAETKCTNHELQDTVDIYKLRGVNDPPEITEVLSWLTKTSSGHHSSEVLLTLLYLYENPLLFKRFMSSKF
jgi:hypothetical protein